MLKFRSKLIEGIIKSRPNRFIMNVQLTGNSESVMCHCPVTGKIGTWNGYINFEDISCLISEAVDSSKRKTKYTVEAISLDPITKKKKNMDWNKSNRRKSLYGVLFKKWEFF